MFVNAPSLEKKFLLQSVEVVAKPFKYYGLNLSGQWASILYNLSLLSFPLDCHINRFLCIPGEIKGINWDSTCGRQLGARGCILNIRTLEP